MFFSCGGKPTGKSALSNKIEGVGRSSAGSSGYIDLEEETYKLSNIGKKYLDLVLKDGAPIIEKALISQPGELREKSEIKDRSKMEAEQVFSTNF